MKEGEEQTNKIKDFFKGIPWWGYLIIAGVGGVVVYNYSKGGSKPGSLSGQGLSQSDIAGIPYDYLSGISGTSIASQPPTSTTTTTTTANSKLTTRNRESTGPFAGYDASSQGLPIRSAPDESSPIVSYIGYGANVTSTGAAISTQDSAKGGTEYWIPVQGGYLASWDIANAAIGGAGMVNDYFSGINVGGAGEQFLGTDWHKQTGGTHNDVTESIIGMLNQ